MIQFCFMYLFLSDLKILACVCVALIIVKSLCLQNRVILGPPFSFLPMCCFHLDLDTIGFRQRHVQTLLIFLCEAASCSFTSFRKPAICLRCRRNPSLRAKTPARFCSQQLQVEFLEIQIFSPGKQGKSSNARNEGDSYVIKPQCAMGQGCSPTQRGLRASRPPHLYFW